MNRHIFLVSAAVGPSSRWQQAFPHALLLAAEQLPAALQDGDVLWLDSAHSDWESLLDSFAARAAVVVLASQPDDEQALRSLSLGARGYAHALAVPARLQEIAEVVARGGLWVGAALLQRFVAALRPRLPAPAQRALEQLSAREHEVAAAVAAGHSNKQIARQLGITERTVKAHLSAIYGKLQLDSRLQLALRFPGQPQLQADAEGGQ